MDLITKTTKYICLNVETTLNNNKCTNVLNATRCTITNYKDLKKLNMITCERSNDNKQQKYNSQSPRLSNQPTTLSNKWLYGSPFCQVCSSIMDRLSQIILSYPLSNRNITILSSFVTIIIMRSKLYDSKNLKHS